MVLLQGAKPAGKGTAATAAATPAPGAPVRQTGVSSGSSVNRLGG
jgi:hypothetical protein